MKEWTEGNHYWLRRETMGLKGCAVTMSRAELVIVDEIVGGRYDALLELLAVPTVPNRPALQADVDTLRPVVDKIRAALR